jgi:hypothetical protein
MPLIFAAPLEIEVDKLNIFYRNSWSLNVIIMVRCKLL